MKRVIPFVAAIAIIFYSTLQAQNNLTFNYYKDKISYIKFNVENGTAADDIERAILQSKDKGAEAVIVDIPALTRSISAPNPQSDIFTLLFNSARYAKKNGMFVFVNMDLSILIKNEKLEAVKDKFSKMIKETELDGIYFSGIDFNNNPQYDLFENLIVEAMMTKPFLSISTTIEYSKTNSELTGKLIKAGVIDYLFDESFDYLIAANESVFTQEKKLLPEYLKRLQPQFVYSLDLAKIADKSDTEVFIPALNRVKQLDENKRVNFILIEKNDSLKLRVGNKYLSVSKSDWVIPYKYIINRDNTVSRTGNWIEFRRPFEKKTSNTTYNLLCRTNYPSTVSINGKSVKQYTTGIFFEKIRLNDGLNKLRAEAIDTKGNSVIYEDRVFYQTPKETEDETKLKIDVNSVQPFENLTLNENDFLTISFIGSKGQKGIAEINPGKIIIECLSTDNKNTSTYQAQIPLKNFAKDQKYSIKLGLKPAEANTSLTTAEYILKNSFSVKNETDFPKLITTNKNSLLTYTLAPIRLGAPLRNELPKDVILKCNGIFGDYYRVRLNDTEEGYINSEYVKELPVNIPLPSYYINPISTYPTATGDVVKIPFLENVPFDVYPDPYQNRIVINLYGVKTSSTWIIHKSNLRFIEEITWQQVDKETYRIFVNLKSSKIWGYELKPNGKELLFKLKYPPVFNLKNEKPLKGIKISIEAGHGGSNSGAVSLSGIKEKDINLKLSLMLGKLFKKHGAEVLQVRDTDKDMLLLEKRDIATNSDANIHFSIHANSSEPENEFLGTSGTCTFYHNPFWAKLAETVFDKLVELNLKPFGSVGSFNYRVTRMSEMPSILVEQAFMSNAEDDEKLADENFRAKMAQKIYDGLINYLKYMSN